MRRALLIGLFAAGAAFSSGCSMCCAPLDYCGPVVESENNCDFTYRRNSIVGGAYGQYVEEAPAEAVVESQPRLQPVPDSHFSPHYSAPMTGQRPVHRTR